MSAMSMACSIARFSIKSRITSFEITKRILKNYEIWNEESIRHRCNWLIGEIKKSRNKLENRMRIRAIEAVHGIRLIAVL